MMVALTQALTQVLSQALTQTLRWSSRVVKMLSAVAELGPQRRVQSKCLQPGRLRRQSGLRLTAWIMMERQLLRWDQKSAISILLCMC